MNNNMEITSKLTIYDTLTYEIIGCLLLLICRIVPSDLSPNKWLFFILAYILGLTFSKLTGNTFWGKLSRNPKGLILSGYANLRKTIGSAYKDKYIKAYYFLSQRNTFNTILILEAQFAFMYNLIHLIIIVLIKQLSNSEYIICIINKIINNTDSTIKADFSLILYTLSLLLLFVLVGYFLKETESKKSKSNNWKKRGRILHITLIVIIVLSYVLFIITKNYWSFIGILISIPLYICCLIQAKISYLIAEGLQYIAK